LIIINKKSIISYKIEKFIYYNHYSNYRMTSTIQLSKETKDIIASFGSKKDTYEDIIKKIYSLAVKEQLREFLMSSKNSIPIEEAIRRAKKEWPK